MEKYIKTIEVLAQRVIDLEKALSDARIHRDMWFDKCQELKKKYEPENK